MSGRDSFADAGGSAGGGGSSGGGSGDSLGLREVKNPSFAGTPVHVGSVRLLTTEAEQSGGQDVPTEPLEGGYDVSSRNVLKPESGTLTGAVSSDGLGALKQLYRQQEPVPITTPEGALDEAFVEDVTRTRSGGDIDAYVVEVTYRQVFLAETGTTTVQAITPDGKATGGGGSDGGANEGYTQSNKGDPSLPWTQNSGYGQRGALPGSGDGPASDPTSGEAAVEGARSGYDPTRPTAEVAEAKQNTDSGGGLFGAVGSLADGVADWATGGDGGGGSGNNSTNSTNNSSGGGG